MPIVIAFHMCEFSIPLMPFYDNEDKKEEI